MKKTYQSPVCQMILVEDLDILTVSIGTVGNFGDDSAVVDWDNPTNA